MVLNLFLIAALCAMSALVVAMRPDTSRPNYEFMPEMVHSPASAAFDANAVFADGKTLQAPPEGTLAHGAERFYYGPGPEEAQRAGLELENPFAGDDNIADHVARGRAVYRSFCFPCHGSGGGGDGPVAQRGFPPPPSLLAEHARDMKDGQIFHLITLGQGNMPPHAAQVSPDDRWKAALYIRSLQGPASPAEGDAQ
jgi:mono/diheme cytochrome c family protein